MRRSRFSFRTASTGRGFHFAGIKPQRAKATSGDKGPDYRVLKQTNADRPEDFLSNIAAIAGELVLRRAKIVDLKTTDLKPGTPLFSVNINEVLSGDRSSWKEIPVGCASHGSYRFGP
jgi:hypothetical protein